MTQRPLPRLLVAGVLATTTWAQVGTPGPSSALPTLENHSLQHLDTVRAGDPATIDVRYEGETYLLELEPHDLRATDFRVLIFDGNGRRELELPAISTYRGRVHDARGNQIEGATVAANLSRRGWTLSVAVPELGENFFVQPVGDLDPDLDAPGLHAVFRSKDILPVDARCDNESEESLEITEFTDFAEFAEQDGTDAGAPTMLAASALRTTRIAFDTDVEYFKLHGSDPDAVVADIEGLMNMVEALFERDTAVTYEVTTIIVRAVPIGLDPYTATDAFGLLSEMTDHWNSRQGGVAPRATAHLMTGKLLGGAPGASAGGGGLFPAVICRPDLAYGVSQSLFTTNVRLRTALTAHHLGHNFGARHCDSNLKETERKCKVMCSVLNGCDGVGRPTFGQPARGFIRRNAKIAGCNHPEPPPLDLPFVDDFPSAPPDPAKWLFNDKADVTSRANVAEPSEPASLKLNANKNSPGFQDDIRTIFIDASGASGLTLSFMSQRKGVEAGEELVIDYVASGTPGWTELARLTSDGVSQAGFNLESFVLPSDALHVELRIRLRIEANAADDRWFVDDLVLAEPESLSAGPAIPGARVELASSGSFPGTRVAFYYSLAGPGTGPALRDPKLQLGLARPIGLIGVAEADAAGRAVTRFFVPEGSPPAEVFIQAVRVRPLTGGSALSAVLPLRIESDPRSRAGAEPSEVNDPR